MNSKMMMIVMIVMMLLLIGVVVGGLYLMMGKLNTTVDTGDAVNTTTEVEPGEIRLSDLFTKDVKDPLSLNLLNSADGSEHAVRVTIGYGVDITEKKESEEVLKLLEENEIVIRDVCNTVLGKKTKEDIAQLEGRTAIKEEILEKLQTKFSSNLIKEVYIGEIYWQ